MQARMQSQPAAGSASGMGMMQMEQHDICQHVAIITPCLAIVNTAKAAQNRS